ncbi:uncharacterized protein [Nicotiana tomentosiformis]|uniref:uncharacterized protein n=1 Tax=Nicotiana tomentosiformis TaxID=4098 RepID=UPI00388CACA4
MPSGPPTKSSIEEAQNLEPKPLPPHLQYTYLGGSNTLAVIVSSDLSKLQEEELLRVLREHKRAIRWMMPDIRSISPSFCMHKIPMEEGYKPSVEHQGRLNPVMKEVVRKAVIKRIDADGYSGYNHISIVLEVQEKTTFTFPYDTYVSKKMPFGLCSAPANFQRSRIGRKLRCSEVPVDMFGLGTLTYGCNLSS